MGSQRVGHALASEQPQQLSRYKGDGKHHSADGDEQEVGTLAGGPPLNLRGGQWGLLHSVKRLGLRSASCPRELYGHQLQAGLPAPAALLPPALLCGACTCPVGIMCRVSKPAFLEWDSDSFQQASYPDIKGNGIQSSHLPMASSQVELVEDKSMGVSIQNTSVIFKGSLRFNQSIDFETDSSVDQHTTDYEGIHGWLFVTCYLPFQVVFSHFLMESMGGGQELKFAGMAHLLPPLLVLAKELYTFLISYCNKSKDLTAHTSPNWAAQHLDLSSMLGSPSLTAVWSPSWEKPVHLSRERWGCPS
ncbi:hypothetical protein MJG53_013921 [Ovis ammon polii x Ovis aries]|uniref:Uncharacterized protein n=1 Tax=Ovis ammon polii x Ovis aries TaxID=2918886 RepID=A0ACB9UK82_9CETA|nr:hypothetical protein MJG53_013921 [Ovis ammon polii x Ovis aries]